MLGEQVIHSQKVKDLAISDMKDTTIIDFPECFTRDEIAASHEQIPKAETVKRWPHLKNIVNELPAYEKNAEIGLLIGMNLSRVMKPRDCIPGKDNDPYAIKTELGWGVIGLVNQQIYQNNTSYCRSVITEEKKCHFAFRTHVTEINPVQVSRMFDIDFNEKNSDEVMSVEDRIFNNKLEEGIHQRSDGHFEMPLPFRKNNTILPNNRPVAWKRLMKLKGNFKRNPEYAKDYTSFMTDMINKNHAEKIPALDTNEGHTWYIPHHGVYQPRKQKLRVVFDCSVQYEGEVLNKHLLQGPDSVNNLTGILCRFRKGFIAFCCDIEGMFFQVGVNKQDRDYLRFLWWENGQFDEDPTEYRMTVHLFGATSSPGCAHFALKHTADTFKHEHGKEAAEFVRRDFYVDDGLKSFDDPVEAVQLMNSSWKLCEMGGFNLRKFICNDRKVLSEIPSSRHANDVQNMDLMCDELPIERTLGVEWCVEADIFQFRVVFQDKPVTRRGILSSVSSIFDPLGLLSPIILVGKKILQDLCHNSVDWDEPLSEDLTRRWNDWKTDVSKLSALEVPRCYKPKEFGVLKRIELHHFSDASMNGYGECSYLRLIDEENHVHTSLVIGKSRVTPRKSVTIPRLELTAAVISVNVSKFLNKELDYSITEEYFWTDSMVVLGYISNESRRFHIYVANRVQTIRDHTSSDQWMYIDTRNNPADIASRGTCTADLLANKLWWKGPSFLSSTDPLPSKPQPTSLQQDDPEVRKVSVCVTEASEGFDLETRLEYFSDWHRAKRAIAACLKFLKRHKSCESDVRKVDKTRERYVPVNVTELQYAERTIIKDMQENHFQREIGVLKGHQEGTMLSVNPRSSIARLDPYIDDDGLLRVGGRANLDPEILHPVILPKNGHVTRLIILHYHHKTGHSGRGITLNEIRSSGYWIISGRSAVAERIRHCVTCCKLRGAPLAQKMSDLPSDRIELAEPFTYSAVDLFGPFHIKQGRSQVKRYGTLFTCLSSRAVHIEIANSLTTDAFINAYRRFVCRRGPVRELRSDRGTNFVGVKKEMESALKQMDNDKIRQELLKSNCDWITFKMNVPHASHMGGVWERMIRSVRSVLTALLDKNGQQLDDELLRTLMTEAEAIVNSRPLTYNDMSSADAPETLCPSQLLLLKSKVVPPPPGEFMREDLYCRSRWRRVQFLANIFWSKWKKEYLMTLQERTKWTRPQRNLAEGDIVLMITENEPRNEWPMARVVDTYPGEDGYIRKVKIAVGESTYERPIHKLVLLMRNPRLRAS